MSKNNKDKCKDFIDSIDIKSILEDGIKKHFTCPDCNIPLESFEELSAHPYGDHIKWKECPKCKKKVDFKVLT